MEDKASVVHNGHCSVAVATQSTSAKAAKAATGVAIRKVQTAEIVQKQKIEWIVVVEAVVTAVVGSQG